MSNITDKELLAICNLSNLKLEFADLEQSVGGMKIGKNHTIYSLLDQEYRSIIDRISATQTNSDENSGNDKDSTNGKSESATTDSTETTTTESNTTNNDTENTNTSSSQTKPVFYRLENEKNPESKKNPIYTNLMEFKKTAGIVYEYYEKYRDYGNEEGKFTDQWQVLYAGDGYKIVS